MFSYKFQRFIQLADIHPTAVIQRRRLESYRSAVQRRNGFEKAFEIYCAASRMGNRTELFEVVRRSDEITHMHVYDTRSKQRIGKSPVYLSELVGKRSESCVEDKPHLSIAQRELSPVIDRIACAARNVFHA